MDLRITRYIAPLLLFMPMSVTSGECATSRCYTDSFVSVDPSSFTIVKRVSEIHEKLGQTIGSSKSVHSKLLVIESEGYPWAVALSDNTIVITTGAINKMYSDGDAKLGDARAAFVLGHELSHLETDDLFHHRAFFANKRKLQMKGLLPKARPEEELRADLKGYTYATIAGYDTDRLLSEHDNFFKNWMAQINTEASPTHPANEIRLEYLKEGFAEILRNVPYYRHAIALAHFGHYNDAQLLLEDLLNHVETKELYSNLGYIHLQRAREEMPLSMAYKYWFPTLLEPASGLNIPRGRGLFEDELPDKAMGHLKAAERYLKQAIDMDETLLTAHVNLAAVYLYMPDREHRAYAAITDAFNTELGKAPSVREQLEGIHQLIRIQDDYDNADRWPKARERIEALVQKSTAAENLIYNFARMLDDRGRDNTADGYWQNLYDNRHQLPAVYRDQVCFRLSYEQCNGVNTSNSPWGRINLPLERDIRYADMQEMLSEDWSASSIDPKLLPGVKAEIFFNEQGDSLLALDNHIEMMILRDIPASYRPLDDLLATFGEPLVSLPLADGTLLSFDNAWAAVVRDGIVEEVWISKVQGIPQKR